MLSLSSPFLIYLGVQPWPSSLYPLHPLSPSLLTLLSSAHCQGIIGSIIRSPTVYFSVHGRFSCPIPWPLVLTLSHPSSPQLLSHPFAIKGPSGHRLFISAFLDGFCALPPYSYPSYLPGSLSQVLSLPSLPGLYHLLPRDHLTPSLPMPQTLLLALLIPTSITSFCHQGIIRSPLIYFSILGQLLCSPLSPSSSLWLDLLGCSPFPHSQASITSSCRHGIIWSPTIYFSVYDGSCVLPPSLMLPICFLPLCTPLFHSRSCSHSLARPLLLVLFCSSQLLSLYASLWTRVLVLYYCSRDFSDNA